MKEYKIYKIEVFESMEKDINNLAKEGWEVISMGGFHTQIVILVRETGETRT